jgi:hypothetical protein
MLALAKSLDDTWTKWTLCGQKSGRAKGLGSVWGPERPLSDRKVVRPSGFEPPTFCSGGRNSQKINKLVANATIANDSQSVLSFNGLRHSKSGTLATVSNASMQGVGTVLGTTSAASPPRVMCESWRRGRRYSPCRRCPAPCSGRLPLSARLREWHCRRMFPDSLF